MLAMHQSRLHSTSEMGSQPGLGHLGSMVRSFRVLGLQVTHLQEFISVHVDLMFAIYIYMCVLIVGSLTYYPPMTSHIAVRSWK